LPDEPEPVTIIVRPSGPYRIKGPITLVDAEGNEFTIDTSREFVALCRCGGSANKPFCDSSHKTIGFQAETTAPPGEGQR